GRLPIHVATEKRNPELVMMLLKKGCIFRKSYDGNTPLHVAAIFNCECSTKILIDANPALIDQANYFGMTALHCAAEKNNGAITSFLLDSGAAMLADREGNYFTTLAIKNRAFDVCKAIVNSKRWPEIRNRLEGTSQCCFELFIRFMPQIALLAMDQCISEQDQGEARVSYDLTLLQNRLKSAESKPTHPLAKCMSIQFRDGWGEEPVKASVSFEHRQSLTAPAMLSFN
ncbi:Transient receptor putative cation channel subfamily A member 1, partial [Cichlidogyrus casuarinus]